MTRADLTELRRDFAPGEHGAAMLRLMTELYPICRSITGEGFRRTQEILRRETPELGLQSVPSGTQAFDWTVPREWNIREAWIKGPDGRVVVDFADCNLHVVSYSVPVRARMPLSELQAHLHSLPEHPQWVPYRTSYYKEDWGFCLRHDQRQALPEGDYEVCIDSSLEDGELVWGECLLPGEVEDEVLLSTHACHPSLCNDNLSGVVVASRLLALLRGVRRRYSYRFLFLPGGIGSVVWLWRNQDRVDRIRHGLVLNCLGDPGDFTYKRSRRGEADVDRAARNVLRLSGRPWREIDFSPYGYDERNYCSPRFDLPVGSLTRSVHSEYPGYHSSGDNLELMSAERLGESLRVYLDVLDVLERNGRYRNRIPDAEPQLGKRGLYGLQGGLQRRERLEVAMLWVMNQSDGEHDLLAISDRSGIDFDVIHHAARLLEQHDLLETESSSRQGG